MISVFFFLTAVPAIFLLSSQPLEDWGWRPTKKFPSMRLFLREIIAGMAVFLILILGGCGHQPNKKPTSAMKGERIARKSSEVKFHHPLPKEGSFPVYAWEKGYPPKITKEFFRCKGKGTHPRIWIEEDGERKQVTDCDGCKSHSLPIREGKEFIYPILMDLLNRVQEVTKKPVMITGGHRCPKHNAYVEPENIYSKHMIGAEVSFYVEDEEPERLVQIIQDYYQGTKDSQFRRFEGKTNVSTLPWFNKEIFIKLYKRGEGRNLDNRHDFPYLSVQVRHDRDLDEPVVYSWPKAHKGYHQ